MEPTRREHAAGSPPPSNSRSCARQRRAYRSVLAQRPTPTQRHSTSTTFASSVAQVYLKRAIAAGALSSVGGGALTKCQEHLATLWEKLVEKGVENKSDAGFSPYRHAVLPDYRSMCTFKYPLRRWLAKNVRVPPAAADRSLVMLADKGVHCVGDLPPAWVHDPAQARAGLAALAAARARSSS